MYDRGLRGAILQISLEMLALPLFYEALKDAPEGELADLCVTINIECRFGGMKPAFLRLRFPFSFIPLEVL